MSSIGRAWVVAASIGAVEVLKDQGICRWNYTLKSLHQHAKNNIRSISQAKRLSSNSAASSCSMAMATKKIEDEKMKQSEEALRKVMYLSCWGPN